MNTVPSLHICRLEREESWQRSGTLSGSYETGVQVDLTQIPMRHVTVELCERYEPESLPAFWVPTASWQQRTRAAVWCGFWLRQGSPAAVIGWAQEGDARRVLHGEEEAGYLERPQPTSFSGGLFPARGDEPVPLPGQGAEE